MENTIDTNYDEVYDYFGDELTENDDRFENYRNNITTTIAYLIGIADEIFTEGDRFESEEYIKLKKQ